MPADPSRTRLRRVEETSAGGLVLDRPSADAQGALIGKRDRRGRLVWSLPKGHLEPGESAEQAAVREVAEETGIRGRVLGALGTVDYWFVLHGQRIHKTVHHFLLVAEGGELSAADVEVDEVEWVPLEGMAARLAYKGERTVLDGVEALLTGTGGA